MFPIKLHIKIETTYHRDTITGNIKSYKSVWFDIRTIILQKRSCSGVVIIECHLHISSK